MNVPSIYEEPALSRIARTQSALSEGRVFAARQGVHDAGNTGTLLYSECLARMVDEWGTVQSAGEFVPLLEVAGGTAMLDLYMLDLVLKELAADPDAVLGCNLSAHTLTEPGHCALLMDIILRHRIRAARLILEITETAPLHFSAAAHEFLKTARAAGCRIAIDDFGAGYAAPARLLDVAVDIVKIDASFTHRILRGHDGRGSLYHIVGLAACAVPVVVVEGVETDEHMQAAHAAGATHLQGYLLSRPAHSPLLHSYRPYRPLRRLLRSGRKKQY